MSKTARSRLQAPLAVEPATPARLPVAFPLRTLAVAPENLRADDAPDDGIAELAETVFAAGLLQPLTVRPGGKDEAPAMVLDGRRRLLALQALRAAGRIDDDYPVSAFVETDRRRQAAAVVLTNTAVPVHIADVIVAIGKMLAARLKPAAIAGALGYGELEVRRLAALSALHPKALEALKAGRCTLRQAKLMARLHDPEAQREIAEAAMSGFGFQEWRVNERLDAGQVTVHDRRFGIVGAAGYAAAGGRLESDLFGERADVVLDPDCLQAAWTARAEAIGAAVVGDRDCQVVAAVDDFDLATAEALEPFEDRYGFGLVGETWSTWRDADAAVQTARAALGEADPADPGWEVRLTDFLAARLAADLASAPARTASLVAIVADSATGLDIRVWGPPTAAETGEDGPNEAVAMDPDDTAPRVSRPVLAAVPPAPAPVAVARAPDTEGVNHGLHELRTDVATRALIRALADDPATALIVVVARLFAVLVLRQGLGRGGAASISAEPYSRAGSAPYPALDGEVRRRLAGWQDAWAASGQSPIAWTAALSDLDRLTLLAELTALSLDLRETGTTSLRPGARAEAVEIAALCGCEVAAYWTPDVAFLQAHPKAKLLAMLEAMGVDEPLAAGARKDELVALVAKRAEELAWAPEELNWRGVSVVTPDGDPPPDPGAAQTPPTDEPATDDEASADLTRLAA